MPFSSLTYVRRAAVSLPFHAHLLKVLVEVGLVTFSSACFEFADEVPEEDQPGILAHLPMYYIIVCFVLFGDPVW